MRMKVLAKTHDLTLSQWLELRRHGIGGSDAGAVANLSPWKSPLDVYYSKVGTEPANDEPNPAMHWGNVLEESVAGEFARVTGSKLRRRNAVIAHSQHEWMLANLDRVIVGSSAGPGILEVKTTKFLGDDWGPDGSDQIPEYYMAQVQHYLAVTGYQWAAVAVLGLSDRDFRVYWIARDDELIDALTEIERRFWSEHVLPQQPPEPRSWDEVAKRWPVDTRDRIEATPEVVQACAQLAAVKAQLKPLEDQRQDLEGQIKRAMEDYGILDGPDGQPLATWKAAAPGSRIDLKALSEDHKDLVERYRIPTQPSRRFLLKVTA